MKHGHIIAVDAGTSLVKSVLFESSGRQVSVVARRNRYHRLPGGGAEQDMRATWEAVRQTLADLAGQVPGGPGTVRALAVTGQGDGTWLIDEAGAPVGNALLWMDARASGIVNEIARRGARDRIFPLTGCALNACNQSAQLLWLEENQPERVAAAATALHCKDWLYFNLTGERATDVTEGAFTYGDFRTRSYSDEVIDELGMGGMRRLLPPVVDGARQTHPLSAAAAAVTGLPAGLPVSLGYVDVVCSALGAGAYAPGRDLGCTLFGSTGMHIRLLAEPSALELAGEPTGYVMAVPGSSSALRLQSHMAGTFNLDWLVALAAEAASLFGAKPDEGKLLEALGELAAAEPIRALLYHPYIDEAGERGPFYNPRARAQFTGLTSSAGFGALARALHEGLAFASRHCYEHCGGVPQEVRMTGGGARSRLLREILAAVLNCEVRASSREETGAAGVAIIAALAADIYPDIGSACADWVEPEIGVACQPNPAWVDVYDRLYSAYKLTANSMPAVWDALAAAV